MPAISYKYRVAYADGRKRNCSDASSASCEVTDEEYLIIVRGVAEGYDIMEISDLEDVAARMKNHVKKYDSYFSLNGMWRETPLKTPREIADVEVFLEKSFITHIRSYKDPVVEMTRPEQTMTVYRSDGSYVEIFYSHGEVTYRDSRKKGQTCMMTADMFLDWVVH